MKKSPNRNRPGFTLVELFATLAIILFVMSVAWYQVSPTVRRNEVLNNNRYVRAAVIRARATAIEYTQPVQLTLTAGNGILIQRDPTRDGNWDDAVLVQGRNVGAAVEAEPSPYNKISRVDISTVRSLPHWTKLVSQGNVGAFSSSNIVILPDGNVWAGNPLQPSSGTWFFVDDRESYNGAVHVTAMGEVKMAIISKDSDGGGDYNGWTWMD
ncbi:MAG: hypothetical protein QNK37_01245 [Acidobacteriota bacterium]|nr:hypothetical protein [Acidobacteriota bacterium]